ncbi:hydrophobin-319 [Coprinopsis sp. MPI-PUGE-AT-0042]|nr:hydrophobin-319 [Coprinopsis sp. MPI-PUGE-AT-0042]
MQFKFLSTLALATLAIAAPTGGTPPSQQCSTGSVQCCDSVQAANSPGVGLLAGLLGIVLGPITGQVGLTCSPIDVLGIGGNSCTAQTVCCTGNSFSGVIVLGCSPINIGL